jgi:hypothetical protein
LAEISPIDSLEIFFFSEADFYLRLSAGMRKFLQKELTKSPKTLFKQMFSLELSVFLFSPIKLSAIMKGLKMQKFKINE